MIQIGKRYDFGAKSARNEPINVLYLRFVELVSFFAIVFITRIIAQFNYRSAELLFVFPLAAFLQATAAWMWSWWGGLRGWRQKKIKTTNLWYTSYVDLLVVVALRWACLPSGETKLMVLLHQLYFIA